MAEKKALKRFLLIYIVSTLFLVGIGEWFYYKISYKNIIENEINHIDIEIRVFLEKNRGMFKKIINSNISFPDNLQIAIYKNKKLIYSNFKPQKIFLDKKYWIIGNDIYYRFEMIKRWGRVDIITKKRLNKEEFLLLYKRLAVFNIFLLLFLIVISYFLGKIFLEPMRKVINNLNEFIRDSTHEMNTPISVILTNIEILKENYNEKSLKRIENSVRRLSKIFDDLKYIRLHHKERREIKKINLKDFIEKRMSLFETTIENKKLKLITKLDDFIIKIDEEDLTRLIDNILSNAFKYAPIGSKIVIKLKNGVFCVENKGEIKNIKNLTKKFVRENKNEGGFGLGLYIVSKISQEYGFRFEIKNTDKKVNACLYFV